MTLASTLLASLVAEGLTVRAEGDTLFITPRSKVTDDHREAIRAVKPALLVLLASKREDDWEERSAAGAERAWALDVFSPCGKGLPISFALWEGQWMVFDPEFLIRLEKHQKYVRESWAGGGMAKAIQSPGKHKS